jgi:hypothetical protein
VNQTVDSLGAPNTAELGLPYQMGSYQRFGSFDNNQPSVITSYAPWGTHVVAGHLAPMWLQHISRSGPARDDAHWLSSRTWGQHFNGGTIWYDYFFEQTYASCLIVNPIDC